MSALAKRLRSTFDAAKRAWQFGTCAPGGEVFKPGALLDGVRPSITKGIDLKRLKALSASMDEGNIADGLQLFEEMEQHDTHLRAVANTRRLSLTGLEWEIVSAADVLTNIKDRQVADEAADFVRESLTSLDTFPETLEHLSTAIGTNLAVTELVWDKCSLTKTNDVPSWRLSGDPQLPGAVRIVTESDHKGIVADPPKFIVHVPNGGRLYPLAKSTLRSQAFIWLVKILATVDWATFATIFGMPVRWAKYRNGASEDEKNELVKMMENMGRNAWAVFSEGVNLEIKESSQRGTAPYEALINWCDRKQTILMLGGNLTADTTGGTGTLAAGLVQDDVKDDLRDDDIRRESRTIRRQLISPMCAFAFPHVDVPLPFFRRVKPETVDRIQEANLFSIATQQIGLPVGKQFIYDRLGIPKPEQDEPIVERNLGAFGEPLSDGLMANG